MTEATSEVMKPGEEVFRPQVSEKTAIGLVERLYNFKVREIKELVSYDDRNFKVLVDETHDNPYVTELNQSGYTLKILNRRDSPNHHVEAEHAMLKVLKDNGISTIQPVLNIHGKDLSRERLIIESEQGDGNENSSAINVVRLMTFVQGQTLHSVPYTPAILYESGCLLGRVSKALESFSHPVLTKFETIWSLKNVSDLREFVFAVKDESNKKVVMDVIEAFEQEVLPNFSKFRKGVVHADFNDQNVIVAERPADQQTDIDKYTVASIIDFGDAHEAYFVMDVAITIMYLMIDNMFMDPTDVGGHVVAGYKRYAQLTPEEFEALHVLAASRFVQSLVMGAYTYSQHPDNEYLLLTGKRGWKVLKEFWCKPKQDVYRRWKEIMDTYE